MTAMLDLALNHGEGPITLAEISKRQDISLSYLEQLFSRLRRQGLVDSVRGPGGGYKLNCAPEEITVVDVIKAVDEEVDATRCGRLANCQGDKACLTHELWCDLSDQIHDFLAGISIAQLVAQHQAAELRQTGTD